jgi:aldose 1-epimerase
VEPILPSGEQFQIAFGEQRATIVEVGGGVREYFAGAREVLEPYPVEAICDGAHGTPLIPWPNRVADGQYRFDGEAHQLALSEPDKLNAIHGLLRWRNWSLAERAEDRVVVSTRLHPTSEWPFSLDVSIAYALGADGLSVTTRVQNVGPGPCPYGSGQHPYLSPGPHARVDDCTLALEAETIIVTDAERQLPSGRAEVGDAGYDFRAPRPLEGVEVDHAFCDLARDAHGLAWARLACPDERTVELWVDDAYELIQIYTGDTLAPARRRTGLAAEPMTCPPNALQSGDSLVRLEPGEEHVARWGVRLG